MSDYRPRLSAELTHEQADALFSILPHGWQKPLFQTIVDGIIELHARGGIEAIGAIVSKTISVEQVISLGHAKNINESINKLEEMKEV